MTWKVRLRGIHTTALSRLLLKNGFELAGMSREMIKRFNSLPESLKSEILPKIAKGAPDATIIDSKALDGVVVIGVPKAVDDIVGVIKKTGIVFTNTPPVCLGDVFLAKVIKSENGRTHLELGNGLYASLPREIEEKSVIVTVRHLRNENIEVTEGIELRDKAIILLKTNKILFSEHLNKENMIRLAAIASSMDLEGNGIRWRSSAALLDDDALIEMLKKLLREKREIEVKAQKTNPPALLRRGEKVAHILFSRDSRRKLDLLRMELCPTMLGHHWGKSLGKKFSEFVDYSEHVIKQGIPPEPFYEGMKAYMLAQISRLKTMVLRHKYPSGREIYIKGAQRELNNEYCVLVRKIQHNGKYDGLNIEKIKGDVVETHVLVDSPVIVHQYYREGELLGIYVNINTPVEIEEGGFRYIDLLVDMVIHQDERKLVDIDDLMEQVKNKVITEKQYEFIMKFAKKLTQLPINLPGFLYTARELWGTMYSAIE